MPKRMFLIDGSAIYYRSYFAFIRNPLINSKGENTSATYGFLMTLMSLIENENPDYLTVIFDTKEPTFRHDIYDQYKATRERMPEEMAAQFPRLIDTLDALNFNRLALPGYEADDLIGTLCASHAGPEMDVFIVSGDKDMAQLVNDHVFLYSAPKANQAAEILNASAVKEKMGIEPEQVIDYLALMGDSSDNIPGVPKVGKKTAANLLAEFGSLDGVYENITDLKEGTVKNNLIEFKEQAELSRRLATIEKQVPFGHKLGELEFKMWDPDRAEQLLAELEFRSLANRVKNIGIQVGTAESFATQEETGTVYTLIKTLGDFETFHEKLKQQTEFVFDLETSSLDFLTAQIAGIAFSWKENQAFYIPLQHPDIFLDNRMVLDKLRPIFADPKTKKIGQNIKFDAQIMEENDVPVDGIYFDTMIASYLLNPAGQHKLDKLSEQYLNYEMIHIEELIGTGKNQKLMTEIPAEKVTAYAAEDADITFKLYRILKPKIKENGMEDLFYNLEMPLVHTLMVMERNGIKLDTEILKQLSTEVTGEIETIQKGIYREADVEFNLKSPQQLGKILFDNLEIHSELNLKKPPRTKTGQYSTSEKILERYREHPVVKDIMNHRKLSKLKNTYLDALPELVHNQTGKVHTSYNQSVAATGRLSSTNPNLQNIPIRTELGREIRRAFVPSEPGYEILSADYSQIELRIMAHLSGDENMISSFQQDLDIHSATAALIFGIGVEEVTADHRRKAKEINFGIIYGMSRFGLAARLHISFNEAEEFINDYFATYPGVSAYMKQSIENASRLGYVETMMHRRRYLPDIQSANKQIREFAERTAINTPIQGSAADLIKKAMNNVQAVLDDENLPVRMMLQVHDELVFEVDKTYADEFDARVTKIMEQAFTLSVPVKVDSGRGSNWLEAH